MLKHDEALQGLCNNFQKGIELLMDAITNKYKTKLDAPLAFMGMNKVLEIIIAKNKLTMIKNGVDYEALENQIKVVSVDVDSKPKKDNNNE